MQLQSFAASPMTSRMARRKRGPGRPKNPERSKVIPVTVSASTHTLLGTIAATENMARATWAQRALLRAIDQHQQRVARL